MKRRTLLLSINLIKCDFTLTSVVNVPFSLPLYKISSSTHLGHKQRPGVLGVFRKDLEPSDTYDVSWTGGEGWGSGRGNSVSQIDETALKRFSFTFFLLRNLNLDSNLGEVGTRNTGICSLNHRRLVDP